MLSQRAIFRSWTVAPNGGIIAQYEGLKEWSAYGEIFTIIFSAANRAEKITHLADLAFFCTLLLMCTELHHYHAWTVTGGLFGMLLAWWITLARKTHDGSYGSVAGEIGVYIDLQSTPILSVKVLSFSSITRLTPLGNYNLHSHSKWHHLHT